MQMGDVVLLSTGMNTIAAIGIVAGDYMYLNQFDDVNGWDLQHARRIRWFKFPEEYSFPDQVFGANPARCSRVWNDTVKDYVGRFLTNSLTYWQEALLPDLPDEEPEMDVVPESIAGIVAEAQDLFGLYSDRQKFADLPTEDELVAHFVIPLLKQLGWPTEHIAVKWRYIDVALFIDLPRTPKNCRFVIEAKRLGAGVEGALDQARGYVKALGVPCDVIVTDGIRYRMYSCEHEFAPIAYANLIRLKQSANELFDRLKRA
jgi:hypothetical protein